MLVRKTPLTRMRVTLGLVLTVTLLLLPAAAAIAATYTVRAGDSLWRIAQRHGTSVAALRQANGIGGSMIYPGQRLQLPAVGGGTYTVQAGDSLWWIAQRHGTSVAALRAANGIGGSTIYPGQRLQLPGGGGTVTTASRDTAALSAADADLVARLVRAEAEAESYTGQVAVAAVVLNRVRSGKFPNTVRGVVYQAHQFEVVNNGRIHLPATATNQRAVRDAVGGWDPSNGALFFFNPAGTGNSFLHSLTVTARIGGHVFAR